MPLGTESAQSSMKGGRPAPLRRTRKRTEQHERRTAFTVAQDAKVATRGRVSHMQILSPLSIDDLNSGSAEEEEQVSKGEHKNVEQDTQGRTGRSRGSGRKRSSGAGAGAGREPKATTVGGSLLEVFFAVARGHSHE